MTFQEAFDKSINSKPELGTYVHLCRVLGESGASLDEVTKHFEDTMQKDEYLKSEKKQLIGYLLEIAQKQPI